MSDKRLRRICNGFRVRLRAMLIQYGAMHLAFFVLFTAAAMAEVPHVITYQGHLVDSLGAPLDGEHPLVFSIYDVPEGGTSLWTSGVQTVMIHDGLFTYDLGSMVPIPDSIFTEHFERWLGVSVGTAQELSPRTVFNSVAFAYRAQYADGADPMARHPGEPVRHGPQSRTAESRCGEGKQYR